MIVGTSLMVFVGLMVLFQMQDPSFVFRILPIMLPIDGVSIVGILWVAMHADKYG